MRRAESNSHAGTIKADVRTPRMTMRISGALDDSLPELFGTLSGKERREAVLAEMAKKHADLTALEEAQG